MEKLEHRIIMAMRAMSPEARVITLNFAEALAKKLPMRPIAPLRLVVHQGKRK